MGILLFLSLAVLLGFLIFLYKSAQRHNGEFTSTPSLGL